MTENRKNKSDSKAFTEEAVALITEQGYSVAEVAKAVVGVRANQLIALEARRAESLKIGKYVDS